ncbi:Telomere length regulation protein elg1 [Cyphellophora attinorum]|uniref:Telomere length regulation protein elg1 n=1 Tax=Cyphellophora attinorum TaxID=1664694 RepID=A0A0N1NZQ5_9EURO|nr:Telomere length regulation protein elg1 [Phialophora attinorum]KPI39125.1 Telomere length regulation protein elg1 [Phialophora attinorum]
MASQRLNFGLPPCIPSSVQVWTELVLEDSFTYLREAPRGQSRQLPRADERPATNPAEAHESSETEGTEATRPSREEHDRDVVMSEEGATTVDDFEVDPNSDRRKRRKLTPAEGTCLKAKLTQEENGQEVAPANHEPWLRQLVSAASEVPDQQTLPPVTEDVYNEDGAPPVEPDQDRRSTLEDLPPTPPPQTAEESLEDHLDPPSTPDTMAKRAGGTLASTPKRPKKATPTRRSNRQSGKLAFKNGRLVASKQLTISYTNVSKDPTSFGQKIEAILKQEKAEKPEVVQEAQSSAFMIKRVATAKSPKQPKVVHPFFLGKAAPQKQDTALSDTSSAKDVTTQSKPVKSWNDLGLSNTKAIRAKDSQLVSVPWVPLELQHIGVDKPTVSHATVATDATRSKQKAQQVNISAQEDILNAFASKLKTALSANTDKSLHIPTQWRTTGKDLLQQVQKGKVNVQITPNLVDLQRRIMNDQSAFDKGLPAGPLDWTHAYAPKSTAEVLQPQASDFREWLKKLEVHNVQTKLSELKKNKRQGSPKKKGRKKRASDLDDFLVSDDEDDSKGASVKNAIIICGPHGCGKTASVYAAAREVGFEVFEIHPGMRRTARDIYDKVGDVTHNHMVQTNKASTPFSRASSVVSDSQDSVVEVQKPDPKQKSLGTFLGQKSVESIVASVEAKETASQKQVLILFEEVDVLFEEDKTFWSGVQTIMANSKRPVVMTCNSLQSLPMEELDVAAILHYQTIPIEAAVEHLVHVAAAEGHLLERAAIRALYISRGEDLRAALEELDFWCQMTVGSKMGGLDWIHNVERSDQNAAETGSRRIVSQDTFTQYINIVPDPHHSDQDLLAFAQNSLDVSIMEWQKNQSLLATEVGTNVGAKLKQLEEAENMASAHSFMDVCDDSILPMLSTAAAARSNRRKPITRIDISYHILNNADPSNMLRQDAFFAALEPLHDDMRTFPPPQGRTAASLDSNATSVVTEVAPFVRQIARQDQQIARQREEIDAGSQGSSGGPKRKTRAARAALEGGSVAGTRVERYLPKELELEDVVATGGDWMVDNMSI